MDDKKVSNGIEEEPIFRCNICNYITAIKSNHTKHLLTARHKRMTEDDKKVSKVSEHLCSCGRIFKYRQGLHKHKLKCSTDIKNNIVSIKLPDENAKENIDTSLIVELIKQNKELQSLLVQQSKEKTELVNKLIEREPNNITNSNNTTNNNNQKFNLNFFLNETCKDAMNIKEFIENIKITFQDLLKIGNDGFVDGLSDIFVKRLRDLDVTKRPIHCTDVKRETIFMKEEDTWNKDDKDNSKLKGVIEK